MKPWMKIAAASLVLAACVWLVVRSARGSDDPAAADPRQTLWICTSDGCGRDFAVSVADLGAFYETHGSGSPPCPSCGKSSAARAAACPNCSKTIPKPARSDRRTNAAAPVCPHCGKTLK